MKRLQRFWTILAWNIGHAAHEDAALRPLHRGEDIVLKRHNVSPDLESPEQAGLSVSN